MRPVEDNLWAVTFANHEQRLYKGVIMCNGHHWCKRFPEFEGEFKGEIIHSKDYTNDQNNLKVKESWLLVAETLPVI